MRFSNIYLTFLCNITTLIVGTVRRTYNTTADIHIYYIHITIEHYMLSIIITRAQKVCNTLPPLENIIVISVISQYQTSTHQTLKTKSVKMYAR